MGQPEEEEVRDVLVLLEPGQGGDGSVRLGAHHDHDGAVIPERLRGGGGSGEEEEGDQPRAHRDQVHSAERNLGS